MPQAAEALLAACEASDVGGAAGAQAAGATLSQALTPGGSNALHKAGFGGHAALCESVPAVARRGGQRRPGERRCHRAVPDRCE